MKILLFGKNGQVGNAILPYLKKIGDVIALDYRDSNYDANFLYPELLRSTINKIKPDIIVNAVAYTSVDKAENNYQHAELINSQSVLVLAQESQKIGALFIHYSTDYIFNGTGDQPWTELSEPSPINLYGKTKLLGEEFIKENCLSYLIFRTSWVYSSKGHNFLNTMISLGKQKEELSVVYDQIGTPTSAELIASYSYLAIQQTINDLSFTGTYNLVADGETSWYGFAEKIFSYIKKIDPNIILKNIHPIPSSQYKLPAERPKNSRLSIQKFQTTFNTKLPSWDIDVIKTINEIYKNH
ncbi:dTDP-4-dehydrorhamnose reductase [Providencia stuartii]|uniref:dTDP-4-dehydrorhamnose reductase n=1 Tax=Providencia stuartii TaxID=588 RepID=UPI0034E5C211